MKGIRGETHSPTSSRPSHNVDRAAPRRNLLKTMSAPLFLVCSPLAACVPPARKAENCLDLSASPRLGLRPTTLSAAGRVSLFPPRTSDLQLQPAPPDQRTLHAVFAPFWRLTTCPRCVEHLCTADNLTSPLSTYYGASPPAHPATRKRKINRSSLRRGSVLNHPARSSTRRAAAGVVQTYERMLLHASPSAADVCTGPCATV